MLSLISHPYMMLFSAKLNTPNRGAQTAVFELDIRISNPPYIDVCQSLASETGLKSRNVEKRINAV
jgi:methylase of polypeptide subunit release factors